MVIVKITFRKVDTINIIYLHHVNPIPSSRKFSFVI